MILGVMPARPRSLLLALDGPAAAKPALLYALDLCAGMEMRLTAVAIAGRLPIAAATVGEVADAASAKRARYGRLLEELAAQAAERDVPLALGLLYGSLVGAVTRYARSSPHDLIALAEHRRIPWPSAASRIARRVGVPVLVLPA